ncbi:siderophore-interacting protein [Nocardioides sp. Kera G14]|uniref:siderophore-interacting protein n=1 Tax=Nocardioides sp. Kera G14 TaxID=2884264 RepID=UPI001D104B27|nr:siderophore-interacting protein [Nocardioides sp. Kera G14]UDY24262.1 siderophore-interacting protein [Nocardioides sp. Kera G14]
MANPNRPARPQHVLRVESSERLSPHLVRLTLSGDTVADFPEANTDAYLKLLFVDPALGLEPPYDVQELRRTLPADQQPAVRTYTVRSVDRAAATITIDFVVHGDEGIAGPWALAARPGDRLVATGPGGAYSPAVDAPFHLLAGDLAALPAIAAALEAMPADATGVALLQIHDTDDRIELVAPEGVEVHWLLDEREDDEEFLARAVAGATWPEGTQVFVHGERSAVRAIRGVLRERGVPREALSISAYWARGRTEDTFQAEKREPIGQID